MLASGCGEIQEQGPDRCADPQADWWPLPVAATWQLYTTSLVDQTLIERNRLLEVQARDTEVVNVAPNPSWKKAKAVRLWRREVGSTGWRWVKETPEGFHWLRDLWVTEPPPEEPDETRDSTRDVYYDPYRLRLATTMEKLCEGAAWQEEYRKVTITIGPKTGQCANEVWRLDPQECIKAGKFEALDVHEQWTVESVDKAFDIQGRHYEKTLCVRRHDPKEAMRDATYCFAAGVGKFLELNRDKQEREELISYDAGEP